MKNRRSGKKTRRVEGWPYRGLSIEGRFKTSAHYDRKGYEKYYTSTYHHLRL